MTLGGAIWLWGGTCLLAGLIVASLLLLRGQALAALAVLGASGLFALGAHLLERALRE
ncbi:MAG: hypothetical protein ACREKA_04555 [Candidatus Methylomirabilales bacterium]